MKKVSEPEVSLWFGLLCSLFGHRWVETIVTGGTLGLVYTSRLCKRCNRRQMWHRRRSCWVAPFVLLNAWEQEDLDTGRSQLS